MIPSKTKPKKSKKKTGFLVQIFRFFAVFFLGLIIFIVGFLVYCLKDFPRPEKFTEGIISQPTKIYDRDGKIVLYEIIGEEKRTIVSLSEIPEFLKQAVIVIEDKNFPRHRGIDFKAIIRAIISDLKIGKLKEGASTITQQMIRTYYLTRKKTLTRKTKEIILSLELEKRHSKDQILEWYLNLIPFGSNIYGVETASQSFFGKKVSDISIAEAAILAAMIKAPSYFSPYGPNLSELLKRKDYVLEVMVKTKHLNKEQAEQAKKEKLIFQPHISHLKTPHFVFLIKDYLEKEYSQDFLTRKGLRVYTTLDYKIQETAEKLLKKRLEEIEIYNVHNGGLIITQPETGEILALVGSRDYFGKPLPEGCQPGINCKFDPYTNTVLSIRQPGSAFKPFVYARAFLKNYTPQTILWDVKTEFNLYCSSDANQSRGKNNSKCYHPQNYDGKYLGPINLKSSLAQSRNIPSVKLLYLTGLNDVLNFVKDFGITTLTEREKYGLSLVLGGGGVKLLEMVEGYGVFANNGLRVPLNFIKKIEDANGNILKEDKSHTSIRIIPSWVAYEINDILSDNEARAPVFGWNSPLYLENYQASVKTGTSQDHRDGWIIGYTPSLMVGIWIGNNNNSPFKQKPAVSLVGPLWKELMEIILSDYFQKQKKFISPLKRITGIPVLDGEPPESHSILYYLNPNDSSYFHWEKGVINFLNKN